MKLIHYKSSIILLCIVFGVLDCITLMDNFLFISPISINVLDTCVPDRVHQPTISLSVFIENFQKQK
jgi:hypothetical protein